MNSNSENKSAKVDPVAKMKKRIIIVLVILCAVIALYFIALAINTLLDNHSEPTNDSDTEYIYFYPPDFEEDITLDESYMDKIRDISFRDANSGLTESLTEDQYAVHGDAVLFATQLIQAVIRGDTDAYNKMFSDEYYSTTPKKDKFTPQKLYGSSDTLGIRITLEKDEEIADSKIGIIYRQYIIKLEYMIYKNNGTFRDDVGSDAMRPVYYVMSTKSGKLLIDRVIYE